MKTFTGAVIDGSYRLTITNSYHNEIVEFSRTGRGTWKLQIATRAYYTSWWSALTPNPVVLAACLRADGYKQIAFMGANSCPIRS